MPHSGDKFVYTPDIIEAVLLAPPSHYLDHVELAVDVDRALHWLQLEMPTSWKLVNALMAGWTIVEIAEKLQATPEAVDELVYQALEEMSVWLNQ